MTSLKRKFRKALKQWSETITVDEFIEDHKNIVFCDHDNSPRIQVIEAEYWLKSQVFETKYSSEFQVIEVKDLSRLQEFQGDYDSPLKTIIDLEKIHKKSLCSAHKLEDHAVSRISKAVGKAFVVSGFTKMTPFLKDEALYENPNERNIIPRKRTSEIGNIIITDFSTSTEEQYYTEH